MTNLKKGLASLALAFAVTALASPSYEQEGGGTQTSTEQIITVAPGQTRFFQIEANPIGGTNILGVSSLDGRRMVRQGERLPQSADPPRE